LRSLTVVGTPVNSTVNIPSFTPGTFSAVTVTVGITNPALASSFQLRAASSFHSIIITVNCAAAPQDNCNPNQCVYSQGYWKNHANNWAVSSLTLGTVSYNKAQLLNILKQPVKGNGLVSLAKQLIAAKLNTANGACVPAEVAAAIAQADQLIGGLVIPPNGNGSLPPASTGDLTAILDDYNNGNAPDGPPHCD